MTPSSQKKKRTHFFHMVLFLPVLALCVLLASRLVERKESRIREDDYLRDGSRADVLLLGSSHMINGISPAVLYEDFGIAAYNLGGHGNTLPVTYWQFVNALDYGSPQYVVIDTYLLEKDYQYLDVPAEGHSEDECDTAVGQLHEVMDAFPNGRMKTAALRDLLQKRSSRMEFYWDFIRYHSRWTELTEDDYEGVFGEPAGDAILGAEMRYEVDPDVDLYSRIDPSDRMEDSTVGKTYLRRILDICRTRGIYAMIVQIPFAENEDLQAIANSAQDIADEYGVPFVNMNYVEDLINPQTDQQSQTHLNALGAAKTTAYLGTLLSRDVGVPDRRGQAGYELWQQAVAANHQQILANILDPADLYAELMMLNFNDVGSIIFINNDSVAFYDTSMIHLIENLSGTAGIETMAGTGLGYCLIHDPAAGISAETRENIPLTDIPTSFGNVSFTTMEQYNLLTVGDDKETNQLDYVNNGDIDVQILLYDTNSGEEIGHLFFSNGGLTRKF